MRIVSLVRICEDGMNDGEFLKSGYLISDGLDHKKRHFGKRRREYKLFAQAQTGN